MCLSFVLIGGFIDGGVRISSADSIKALDKNLVGEYGRKEEERFLAATIGLYVYIFFFFFINGFY